MVHSGAFSAKKRNVYAVVVVMHACTLCVCTSLQTFDAASWYSKFFNNVKVAASPIVTVENSPLAVIGEYHWNKQTISIL